MVGRLDGAVDIVDFAEDKEAWLRQFLELPNGIPSHDTFARVFQLLDPQELQRCYQNWIRSIKPVLSDGDIVPIDGKTMRRSHDRFQEKSAVHLLHAWSVEAGLVLGQRVVDEKSNEIPEIPELLKILSLKGCIVTLDAMGCQRDIAQAIVSQHEADYVIALKENQGDLYNSVKTLFDYGDKQHPRLLGQYNRAEETKKTAVGSNAAFARSCMMSMPWLYFASKKDGRDCKAWYDLSMLNCWMENGKTR